MADSPGGNDGRDAGGDGISRRRLVQLLVVLAFGIPILIEGMTLLGFVENWTGGEDDVPTEGSTPTPVPSANPTATPVPVGEGEELLPETPQTDRVSAIRVDDTADGRELTLLVAVANDDAPAYRLQLSRLTTADGDQIQGGGSTDTLGPGESTTLTARWALPADAEPVTVEAVATTRTEAGETYVVREVVRLAIG